MHDPVPSVAATSRGPWTSSPSSFVPRLAALGLALACAGAPAAQCPVERWSRFFGHNLGWRVGTHPRFLADMNRDGRADVVGFGAKTVDVALAGSRVGFLTPKTWLATGDFTPAKSWSPTRHVRLLVDVNRDGVPDVVGFGEAHVLISFGKSNGFDAPRVVLTQAFTFAGGWRVDRHPRYVVDVNGDGRPDILGFGEKEVLLSMQRPNGTFAPPIKIDTLGEFVAARGWVTAHRRFLVDLNGDKLLDLVGFGPQWAMAAVLEFRSGAWRYRQTYRSRDFTAASGWRVDRHPRTVADVTGDGRVDLVGFGENDVSVAPGVRGAFFRTPPASWRKKTFTASAGWRVGRDFRLLGDLDRDGRADVVGVMGNTRVASISSGRSFAVPQAFTCPRALDATRHVVRLADVDGDRTLDAVMFADDGIYVMRSRRSTMSPIGQSPSCKGTTGKSLALGGHWRPHLGASTFRLVLKGARPNTTAAAFLGSIGFTQFGPCLLRVAIAATLDPVRTDPRGEASIPLPIPNDPGLLGGVVTAQAFAVDVGGPVLGLGVLSNALSLQIGLY